MLAAFRHLANTWPARILLVILGLSFASWGIADVVRMVGSGSTAVATVQGHDITPQQFLTEYQSTLRRTSERLPDPSQIPASVKMSVARQTLEKLVTQQAIADEIRALGLASPDDQVRQTVFAMPDFQDRMANSSATRCCRCWPATTCRRRIFWILCDRTWRRTSCCRA